MNYVDFLSQMTNIFLARWSTYITYYASYLSPHHATLLKNNPDGDERSLG